MTNANDVFVLLDPESDEFLTVEILSFSRATRRYLHSGPFRVPWTQAVSNPGWCRMSEPKVRYWIDKSSMRRQLNYRKYYSTDAFGVYMNRSLIGLRDLVLVQKSKDCFAAIAQQGRIRLQSEPSVLLLRCILACETTHVRQTTPHRPRRRL